MGILLVRAELLALFLESVLYGIFLLLYFALLVALLYQGDEARVRQRTLLPVASLMLVLATAHVIIGFIRCYAGFTSYVDPLSYFENIAHPLFVAKNVIYATQTLIGDGVLIWRCYMVYGKRLYVIAVPAVVQLANACVGYVVCWEFSQANKGSTVFASASRWITTFFALTMCINVSCTIAMCWRIYRIGHFTEGTANLMPVVTSIVESGTLYSAGVLGLLISYLKKSNGQYAAIDVIPPLVGITFTLISLQIHFRLDPTRFLSSAGSHIHFRRTARSGPGRNNAVLPMDTFSVHIRQETEVDSSTFPSSEDSSKAKGQHGLSAPI